MLGSIINWVTSVKFLLILEISPARHITSTTVALNTEVESLHKLQFLFNSTSFQLHITILTFTDLIALEAKNTKFVKATKHIHSPYQCFCLYFLSSPPLFFGIAEVSILKFTNFFLIHDIQFLFI